MHDYITSNTIQSPNNSNNRKLPTIEEEYNKLAHQRGAVLQDIVRIERTGDSRFLFEDAWNGCLRRGTVSYIGTSSYDSGALLMLGLSCRH